MVKQSSPCFRAVPQSSFFPLSSTPLHRINSLFIILFNPNSFESDLTGFKNNYNNLTEINNLLTDASSACRAVSIKLRLFQNQLNVLLVHLTPICTLKGLLVAGIVPSVDSGCKELPQSTNPQSLFCVKMFCEGQLKLI